MPLCTFTKVHLQKEKASKWQCSMYALVVPNPTLFISLSTHLQPSTVFTLVPTPTSQHIPMLMPTPPFTHLPTHKHPHPHSHSHPQTPLPPPPTQTPTSTHPDVAGILPFANAPGKRRSLGMRRRKLPPSSCMQREGV